ncbi:MAG TPA: alanyl-tRNA editing protein, partial [Nocardioides sp.]|nr:alanyl-tRNA editing protein [Nocardioides sp.]
MAVPGNAPADLAATELFAVDAYATEFAAKVVEVDREGGRIRLDRTAFYPSGGGQPHDLGTIQSAEGTLFVTSVRREAGAIWHQVGTDHEITEGTDVHGVIDWTRRHQLMRTHTALHILCGVIWADYGIPVS